MMHQTQRCKKQMIDQKIIYHTWKQILVFKQIHFLSLHDKEYLDYKINIFKSLEFPVVRNSLFFMQHLCHTIRILHSRIRADWGLGYPGTVD